MKAARIRRFGSPDVIDFEEVPRPEPDRGEVLVAIKAAGVGPWDGWIRSGRSVLPQPLPLTLGADFSGVVAACGEDVEDFAPGDAVFGVTNGRFTGAYADYAVAEAGRVAPKPKGLSDIEAASIPVVAVTAWQMLHDYAGVRSGKTVVVNGAAGNVGAYAVQIARDLDAHVVAAAASPDEALLRKLGADDIFDLESRDDQRVAGIADAVIDTIGGEVQDRCFAMLAAGGVLVSAVSEPDAERAQRTRTRVAFMLVDVTRSALQSIAALFDAHRLIPRVGRVLPLSEAREAHALLEGRGKKPQGRIVLQVDP